MDARTYLLQYIRQVRTRINTGIVLRTLLLTISIGAACAALLELLARRIAFYYVHYAAAALLLLSAVVGILWGLLRRKGMETAAARIDSYGLEERIITAYGAREAEDSLARMQREDAAAALSERAGEIRIPLGLRWWQIALPLLLAALLITVIVLPNPIAAVAKEKHIASKEAEQEEEGIEEALETLEAIREDETNGLTPEEREELSQMMESLAASMRELEEVEDLRDVEIATQKLDYKYEDIANALAQMASEVEARERTEQAQQEAEQQATGGMPGEQGEPGGQTSQQLSEAAQQIGARSENQEPGESGESGGNEPSGESGEAGGDGQQGQSGEPGGDGQQGENGESGGDGQQGQNGENGGNAPSGESGDAGEGGQTGSGADGEGEQGSGSAGEGGQGQSSEGGGAGTPHDYVSLPNADGDDGNLYGQRGEGDSSYGRYENGIGWSGTPTDYSNVMGEYSERAYQGIESGHYPAGMVDVIRDYFSSYE